MNAIRISVFSLLGAALGTFCFLGAISFINDGSMLSGLITSHANFINEAQPDLMREATEMEAIKIKISNSELLAKTISFYETIIQLLVGLIAVIGVVAFMYIRAASIDHAEQVVESAVQVRFEKNEFHELLKKYLSEDLKTQMSDIEHGLRLYLDDIDKSNWGERISSIERELKSMTQALSKLDREEGEGEQITITEEGDENGNA